MTAERVLQRLQHRARVADHRERAVLVRVVSGDVDLREPRAGPANSAREPVVKSVSRVPTPITRSALGGRGVGGARAR